MSERGHRIRPTQLPGSLARHWRSIGAWRDESLWRSVSSRHDDWPDSLVVLDGVHRITFAQFEAITARLVSGFMSHGVEAGDVVTFQLPNWWEAVAIGHAAMRMGAIANPVLPNLRAHELSFIVGQARPRLLLVPERFNEFNHLEMARSVAGDAQVVAVRGSGASAGVRLDDLLGHSDALPSELEEPGGDDPALLLYTSGTTAQAKGVIHTHNTLRAEADGMEVAYDCTRDDVILVTMPFAHIGGVLYGMLLPFTVGLTALLLDRWDGN